MTDQSIDQTLLVPHPPPPTDFQLPKYPSGLLTLGEAASLLRVHPNTLRHWEEQGRVSSVRIGARRDRRFFRAELQKLFDSPEIQVRTQNRKEAQLNAQLNPAELISIVDAAKNTPYSAEYLSLLARRGLIDAIKIGRNWATTRAIVCAYTERHKHLVQRLHETPRPASNDPGTAAPAVSASSPPTVPPQSSGPDAAANSGDSSGSSGAPSTISAPAPSASPTAAPAQAPADPVATPGS